MKRRVVTVHASDRFLAPGASLDALSQQDGSAGYAAVLKHGETGTGMNDYDAIFAELKSVNFNGWISIEDGVDGMEQLERSVTFLRKKINEYWKN